MQKPVSFIAAVYLVMILGCGREPATGVKEVRSVPQESPGPTAIAPPRPKASIVTFDDLNLGAKGEEVFREEMLTPRVREIIEKRVRVTGVMFAPAQIRGITEFVLMKFIPMKYGPGGPFDQLISVTMREGETAEYLGERDFTVEGVLRVDPWKGPDGYTWSVYDLDDAVVVAEDDEPNLAGE